MILNVALVGWISLLLPSSGTFTLTQPSLGFMERVLQTEDRQTTGTDGTTGYKRGRTLSPSNSTSVTAAPAEIP